MQSLIELISEAPPGSMALPELNATKVPKCVQEIRFKIERGFSEVAKPAVFSAKIAVRDGNESYVCQIKAFSWQSLRRRLGKTLTQIRNIERRAAA